MKNVTLTLTAEEAETLRCLIADHATDLSDNGKNDSPDSELLYKVAKNLRLALAGVK